MSWSFFGVFVAGMLFSVSVESGVSLSFFFCMMNVFMSLTSDVFLIGVICSIDRSMSVLPVLKNVTSIIFCCPGERDMSFAVDVLPSESYAWVNEVRSVSSVSIVMNVVIAGRMDGIVDVAVFLVVFIFLFILLVLI